MSVPSDTAVLRATMRFFEIEQRQLLAQHGSVSQSRLLVLLSRHGPLSQIELVRITTLEKSWMSRAIDRLVEHGWVTKQPSELDRRSVSVELTRAGRKQAQQIEDLLDKHAESVLQRLPVGKRKSVIDALGMLQIVLEPPVKK